MPTAAAVSFHHRAGVELTSAEALVEQLQQHRGDDDKRPDGDVGPAGRRMQGGVVLRPAEEPRQRQPGIVEPLQVQAGGRGEHEGCAGRCQEAGG